MRKRTLSQKPKAADVFTPALIIDQMAAHGASFRFSPGGQMYVANLSKVPAGLSQMFLNHEQPSLLVAAVRQMKATSQTSQRTPVTDAGGQPPAAPIPIEANARADLDSKTV